MSCAKMNGAAELSIVIPAYNEEARLPATLRRIAEYLRAGGRSAEVIVVDDGSRDRTAEVARSFAAEIPSLRVLSNGVIGSRALDRSLIEVHETPFREFAGIIFNKIVRILLFLPFVDTQCGFKAFLREPCRILFEQQRIERFGFDPELLFLAKRHGLRAAEIPVRWAHSPATRVSMLRDSVFMFLEVVQIRWNALAGRYPKRA